MAIGDALTAPTGVQNQMVGQPSRVPGYDQGYAQAPGMPRPTQPNPMGRPTAVVGGPAYFTPEGYNAPPQPTQAFMPTDRAPDPIGQQFMRQMQSPMGQQYQQQYEAIQAPMREAEMAQRAEEQAAQDARFQEMMDRIAELEGQVAASTPTEPTAPMPGDVDPYVPGGTFPGIPDFIRDLDFSGLPDFSGIDFSDYDLGALGPIIDQYNDRIEMGEPEPIDTFIEESMRDERPDPRDIPPASVGGPGGPPPPPPANGFSPGVTIPGLPDFSNLDFSGLSDLNLEDMDFSKLPVTPPPPPPAPARQVAAPTPAPTPAPVQQAPVLPMGLNPPLNMSFNAAKYNAAPVVQAPVEPVFTPPPAPTPAPVMPEPVFTPPPAPAPVMPEPNSFFPGVIPDFSNIDFSKINIPDFQSPVIPTPAPAPAPRPEPIYIPPTMVPNIPKIPNIPNIDFSNLPKAGGMRGMDFSNFGNFNLR